jgi:hypothetical protein
METSNKSTGEQLSLWTSSAADTHANHSAQQENDEAQTTLDTYGHGYETPLAQYDPDTRSWKTSGDISLWGEQPSLESLPKSGMTRNGVLYRQPDWVRPIDGIASSLLHTPTATMKQMSPSMVSRSGWWPTPVSSSAMAEDISTVRQRLENGKPYKSRLIEAIAMWPTPTTVDTFTPPKRSNPTLGDAARQADGSNGKLNPAWVEWLMGFPLGWTDLED